MKSIIRLVILGAILGPCLVHSVSEATLRYVKPGATGTGTSWPNASGNLQQMIDASTPNSDQVWVETGTYSPGSTTNSTFTLKNGVGVFGGFFGTPGTEGNPNARNADPASNNTVLTGVFATGTGNVLTVVTGANITFTATTILDGFTITGGNGGSGAGITLGSSASSPRIANCRLTNNFTAANGGAISVSAGLSSPVIEDCTFENNTAAAGGAFIFAGTTSLALPQITRCRFVGNVATGTGGGGAIFHNQNGSPGSFGNLRVRDCIFIANESRTSGGGAVVLPLMSHSEFTQCLFSRNSAFRSGGATDE